jgi:hypothetical protein
MAAWRQFDRIQEPISVKEDTGMRSMLASMAVALAFFAAPAASAEFPKTGEAEYDTYYVFDTLSKIDSGAGVGAIVDITGINRNVKGEGPFHDMSQHCVGHWSKVGETFDFPGSCVETDRDGDNVFTTFDNKNHYFVGGTGKYKGITGTIPYSVTELRDAAGGAARPASSTTRPPGRSSRRQGRRGLPRTAGNDAGGPPARA